MCRWIAYSGSPIALENLSARARTSLALRALYPDNQRLAGVSEETRLIVSEPLSDLPGVWNEIPEASCGVVQAGQDNLRPFRPGLLKGDRL